jgi:hypothetical protein
MSYMRTEEGYDMTEKEESPAECNEGLGQSRGRASNAGLGSSAPLSKENQL